MLDLENKEKHIKRLNSTYMYVYDTKVYGFDKWRIMKEEPYLGDCEDYALTLLWFLSGKSMWNFWKNLFLGRAKIQRVLTKDGTGHVVLKIGDLYADNWTREFVSWSKMEEIGHKKFYWHYIPIEVVYKMTVSLLKKNLTD